MERLQKVIASSGVTSRRKAEELILTGRVRINGKTITELGTKVTNNDIIEVDGKTISKDTPKIYYLLNKPYGVITSTKDEKNRQTVIDLIPTAIRIYPVGRLDYDTTGLLILTNDGELTNLLLHLAKIKGFLTKEDITNLKNGITIDNRKVDTSNFKIKTKDLNTNTTLIEITIYEGRNHIVKKIFNSLNHPVLRLKRTKIAFLDLKDLPVGSYRQLKIKEIKKLYSLK